MLRVPLGSHQIKAINALDNGKILNGDVGSGKSRASIAYFLKSIGYLKTHDQYGEIDPKGGTPRDLYVITTARKRDTLDWEGEAVRFGITKNRDESLIPIQLTVDSWNNIAKYKNVTGAFFIFDEQRVVGSGAWVKYFLHLARRNQWILLSATPGDRWIDYVPVFVANGFYANKTEFTSRHCVYSRYAKFPKIERYTETMRLERLRRQILVPMDFKRKTRRHVVPIIVEYDKELFDVVMKKRWDPYLNEPIREPGKYYHLMRRVVNSDLRRLKALVEGPAKKHDRLIIFYSFDYELDILRTLEDILDRPLAEWNGHKHEPVPEGDKWTYLVQYLAGSEAWNCTTTNAMVFYSQQYSWRLKEQCKGRTDRLNTLYEDLYYYELRSMAPIEIQIRKAQLHKQDFNERDFKIPKEVSNEK